MPHIACLEEGCMFPTFYGLFTWRDCQTNFTVDMVDEERRTKTQNWQRVIFRDSLYYTFALYLVLYPEKILSPHYHRWCTYLFICNTDHRMSYNVRIYTYEKDIFHSHAVWWHVLGCLWFFGLCSVWCRSYEGFNLKTVLVPDFESLPYTHPTSIYKRLLCKTWCGDAKQ